MEQLFGIPTASLLPVLLVIVAILLLLIVLLSLKNRFVLNLIVKELPRRPAQTSLIIAGLAFSTVIITVALITGETLTHSIRNQSLTSLGKTDLLISMPSTNTSQPDMISQTVFTELRRELADDAEIEAFVPAIILNVALSNAEEGQSTPNAQLFAPAQEYDDHLADLLTVDGDNAAIADLASGEVYLNERGAEQLAAAPGDSIELFAGEQPITVKVKAIVQNRALFSSALTTVVVQPLAESQRLLGFDEQFTTVLVSSTDAGTTETGSSSAIVERLRAKIVDQETAGEIVSLLQAADTLNVLREGAIAIPEQEERLRQQANVLVEQLEEDGISDRLLGVLADERVESWILSRDLPQETLERASALFSNLSEFNISEIKEQAIAEAEQTGSVYSQLFLVFGSFSIFAGMLLIFQIFVMLAAERESELGMARAVGMQRTHLVQFFVTTGVIYDLLAAVIGVILGLIATYLMVSVIGGLPGNTSGQESTLTFHASPRSLLLAFSLGMLSTFIMVTFSAWRVSRLNIIAAIRNLPDYMVTERQGAVQRVWQIVRGPLLILLGVGMVLSAQASGQLSPALLGVAMAIVGGGLLLRLVLSRGSMPPSRRDRIVFTLVGLGLLVFFAAPFGTWDVLLGLEGLEGSADVYIISGIMIVAGALWLLLYNGPLLIRIFNVVFSRIGSLAPVLKTATAYPLSNQIRTGMTLAMFSIVIFTVIVMTIIAQADEQVLERRGAEVITGGYDVQAVALGNTLPPADLDSQILNSDQGALIAGIGTVAVAPIQIRQVGVDSSQWTDYRINGYDNRYLEHVREQYAFKLRAPGFESDEEVWQMLRERADVIVVGRSDVPSSQSVSLDQSAFMLESFFWEDEVMPMVEVEVRLPQSDELHRMQVIGVLNSSWIGNFVGGVHIGRNALEEIVGQEIPATVFYIEAKDEVDSQELAQALEKEFLAVGLNTTAMRQLILNSLEESKALNQLLRGFIALGLFIGIISLGVISSRSVVERRQQIGMLRAIGYQRRMVLLTFLLEAAFIATMGILIGTLLGLNAGWNIINQLATDQPGLIFDPPLTEIMIINFLALGLALLMTVLSAWRAAQVTPAEALRYE
jgi:putative ABC transport system permease protein